MTTYSEITITFNRNFKAGDSLNFKVTDNVTSQQIVLNETWRLVRTGTGEVTAGAPTATSGELSAITYALAFNLDYNSTGVYEVTQTTNVVVIKSTKSNLSFSDGNTPTTCFAYQLTADLGSDCDFIYYTCSGVLEEITIPAGDSETVFAIHNSPFVVLGSGTITALPTNLPNASFVYNNFTGTPFSISDVTISEADSDPCNNVKLTVTTSIQASNITSPISGIVTTNPYVFTYPRGSNSFDVTMIASVDTSVRHMCVPKLLTTNVAVKVINTPSQGATANINVNLYQNITINGVQYPLIFEYSLDNVTWQNVNSFTGLAVGNYTAYVRDSIGCSVSVPFEITTFSPNLVDFDPVSRISNLNSIRFKEDAVFSNCGTRKLPTNTLSFNERDNRPDLSFVQLVQQCDTLKTQLDANYETITAKIVDCEGTETALTVSKMTDNMNKTDVRDGTVLIKDSGLVGIRFGEGLTYDPTTLFTNGSYNLGSVLMSWVNVGDYVNLQGAGWVQILNVLPSSDTIPYAHFVTSYVNNGFFSANQVIQVQSVYNVVDFERYEFSFAALLLSGYYYIKVETTDDNFTNKSFTSEWLWVQETHQKHYLIDYYNSVNNEINYSTGIRHRMRTPYVLQLKWKPSNTQDLYVTDQNTILLESRVREFYSFLAAPLPTAMAQKVVLALSLDRLFIDGQSYLMEGEPEAVPFGDTNLYQVKATLVKADYVFDTNSNIINQDLVIDGVPLAIIPNNKGMLFID